MILSILLLLSLFPQVEELGSEYFGSAFTHNYKATELAGGICSPIYKVDYQEETYVFRFSPSWQTLSKFWRESYIAQWMHEKGIAPPVYHVSKNTRGMIFEYIPHIDYADLRNILNDEISPTHLQLVQLLKEMHSSLHFEPFRFIYFMIDWIETEPFPHPQVLYAAKEWVEIIEKHYFEHVKPTLCHFDLHLGNILCSPDTDEMYLIDWTDSSVGDPFYDLAKLTYNLIDKERMLALYLGHTPTTSELAHLNLSIALLEMVIAVNQMQQFGNEQTAPFPSSQMESDYLTIDPKRKSGDPAYYKSLRALKRFMTLANDGHISEWLNNL